MVLLSSPEYAIVVSSPLAFSSICWTDYCSQSISWPVVGDLDFTESLLASMLEIFLSLHIVG